MGAVVGNSNQACLYAVAWEVEWVAAMRNIGPIGSKYAVTVNLFLEDVSIPCFLCIFM
jgi:hypothetical protein